jgi:hypothetical protein
VHRHRTARGKREEPRDKYRDEVDSEAGQEASQEVRGSEIITSKLKELVEANELVFQTIDILKSRCVYCEFIPINGGAQEELYTYIGCFLAKANRVGY